MPTIDHEHALRRASRTVAHWLGAAALIGVLAGARDVAARPWVQDAASAAPWLQHDPLIRATPGPSAVLDACLQREWLFVPEESSGATLAYRPADYPLGPARGRFGYEFLAGGQLVYRGIGPADGPLTSPGQWAWIAPDQIHISVNDPQGAFIDETLRILSCDAELLRVEQLSSPGPETAAAP